MILRELPPELSAARAFSALRGRPYPCFLDGARGSGPLGRRSFVACDPFLVVHVRGGSARLSWPRTGREEGWRGNPFDLLRRLLAEHRPAEAGPAPLCPGGAVGYLGYDLFPHVERIARRARDDLQMPELFLGFYDAVGIFDRGSGRNLLAVSDWGGPVGPKEDLLGLWTRLALHPPPVEEEARAPGTLVGRSDFRTNLTREEYRRAVLRVKEYIAAGDIYQANLTQRFTFPFRGDLWAFYRRLRRTSPAPFGACLFPDGFTVLSNSPERYLLIDAGRIETRPIKGTRPRGRDPEEDRRLAEELAHSEKDRAEHVMIVDLERNDLGRVCAYDSVHVSDFEAIESYANVHHMVSTVAGTVHPSRDVTDCVRNSFPGGSITGAPKVRAMEVIDELEPTFRGVYCGSIGYLDFSGRVDLNIAIRTAVHRDGELHFQVGGGIVADSDPEEEYEETLTKAQSFLKALTGEGRIWSDRASA